MQPNTDFIVTPGDVSIDIIPAVKRALSLRPERVKRLKPGTKHSESNTEKLQVVTNRSHEVLFRANTVFPFNFFPDTVTIDREKLTIAERLFFRWVKLISIPIRDILSVEADIGPLFGSVHMTSRYFSGTPYSVNFLMRRDALKLQRLLQGYIIAHERKIECSSIEGSQLIELLGDLGTGAVD